jgi:hypothetical protein
MKPSVLIHPTTLSISRCLLFVAPFPQLLFHTTRLSFSVLQAMHEGSSGERFDPRGGAPPEELLWGGGRTSPVPHAEDPLPPHPGSEPQGRRACRRPPPRGAHRRLGRSSPWPLLCAAPSWDIAVAPPLSSPQAL